MVFTSYLLLAMFLLRSITTFFLVPGVKGRPGVMVSLCAAIFGVREFKGPGSEFGVLTFLLEGCEREKISMHKKYCASESI